MMSKNARDYCRQIPIEIIFDILLLLPAKSIARCRCVCRAWASMLRGPDFTEMFLTRSCAQPQLLFACQTQYKEVLFFSSPQPQNLDGNSSVVVVDYRMKFFFDRSYGIVTTVSGLVCFKDRQTSIRGGLTPAKGMVICNPANNQCITLPKMNMRKRTVEPISFFGYDPVEKQFKVLSMAMYLPCEVSQEHQVFTLGTGEPSWRSIECGVPHCAMSKAICINGVLYYVAKAKAYSPNPVIICFDVRTEKFSFVRVMDKFESVRHTTATLVNYKGKVASLKLSRDLYLIGVTPRTMEICILENPEKHEWSNHVYEVPHLWPILIGEEALFNIIGVIADTNEVVFSPRISSSGPVYVYYYSLERGTMRRVEIQGLRAGKDDTYIQTFVNHVENVRFM